MHHARWNPNGDRATLPDPVNFVIFGVSGAIFPQVKFVFAVQKHEKIGLVNVFMRAAGDTRLGHAKVGHGGPKAFRQGIVAVKLRQPAALILISVNLAKNNSRNLGMHRL